MLLGRPWIIRSHARMSGVTLPEVLSSFEFAPAVLGYCILGGGSGLRCRSGCAVPRHVTG